MAAPTGLLLCLKLLGAELFTDTEIGHLAAVNRELRDSLQSKAFCTALFHVHKLDEKVQKFELGTVTHCAMSQQVLRAVLIRHLGRSVLGDFSTPRVGLQRARDQRLHLVFNDTREIKRLRTGIFTKAECLDTGADARHLETPIAKTRRTYHAAKFLVQVRYGRTSRRQRDLLIQILP